MKDWKEVLISASTSILKALQIIDESALQIALIIDANNYLLGTVTDGDIRRGILKGISLSENVSVIMNVNPTVGRSDENLTDILELMKRKDLRHIPIVDEEGRIQNLHTIGKLLHPEQCNNIVIIMAGGLGTRLQPLTDNCPKPLLKIGGKPLLETIVENIIFCGFRRIYISVNYMAEMVEEYFGDGAKWNVDIRYIRENKRMGTAGALGLLDEKPNEPFLVMNGDLLTKVNFKQLLDFHLDHQVAATMCVRDYEFQVPYGVVNIDKHQIIKIEEKPIQHYFINAGIYVLNPETLEHIPQDTFYDMPSLFTELIHQKNETAVFPIVEYWLDIGRLDDFNRANGEFSEVFG